MKLGELLAVLGDKVISFGGDLSTDVCGATPDSRQVKPGMLFCAMKGARLDGHKFIDSALEKGAKAVLLVDAHDLPQGTPWIQVRDPYPVFGLVAEAFAGRPADKLDVLAVTGTNGKTTTAYLLRALWRGAGKRTGMIGTVEYDVLAKEGTSLEADRTTPTPFELQGLLSRLVENGGEAVAMELSSHALEQRRAANMKCSAAIFTNLTQDHLDYHLTMENYYQAKKLLFTDFLKAGAPAVLNCDDPYGARLADELSGVCNVKAYSFKDAGRDYGFKVLELSSQRTVLEMRCGGEVFTLETPLIGMYNAYNVAGAAVCAHACGLRDFGAAIAQCKGAPGRLERVPVPANRFSVFVDYAHTDDALKNVLGTLRELKNGQGRLIVVFGCGGDRDRKKRPLMAKAAASLADYVYVTSDNPRTEKPEDIIAEILTGMPQDASYTAICDRAEAIKAAISSAREGDIILIAGKGHEDYQEINGVKHPFDDRIVAAKCL